MKTLKQIYAKSGNSANQSEQCKLNVKVWEVVNRPGRATWPVANWPGRAEQSGPLGKQQIKNKHSKTINIIRNIALRMCNDFTAGEKGRKLFWSATATAWNCL